MHKHYQGRWRTNPFSPATFLVSAWRTSPTQRPSIRSLSKGRWKRCPFCPATFDDVNKTLQTFDFHTSTTKVAGESIYFIQRPSWFRTSSTKVAGERSLFFWRPSITSFSQGRWKQAQALLRSLENKFIIAFDHPGFARPRPRSL